MVKSKKKPQGGSASFYGAYKRALDVFFAALGLVLFSPLFFAIAFAICVDSRGPILFRQVRMGRGMEPFLLYKFRTMSVRAPRDAATATLSSPERYITRVGSFLRKTSLDELPQLFNIFSGKMSIIGPRPALWNQYDLIEERDKYGANDIKPGLTGWAQINGRDELEIPIKAGLDGEYVKRMGFLFDCKCFFGTFLSVLKSDGVVEGGTGEMKKQEEAKQNEAQEANNEEQKIEK